MLLKAQLDVEKANQAIQDGSFQRELGQWLEQVKPEAAYFTVDGGKRTCLVIVNMDDVSEMPKLAEPLFMGFGASVDFTPVMTGDDLQRGLAAALG